jgi:hypothetical protein
VVVLSFFLPRIPRRVSVVFVSSTTLGSGDSITTRSGGGGVSITIRSGGGGAAGTTTTSGGGWTGWTIVMSAAAACREVPSMPLAAITTELKRILMFIIKPP